MGYITAITWLLRLVNLIIKSVDEAEQRKIGEDRVIQKLLLQTAIDVKIAKAIDIKVDAMSDDDIRDKLRDYFRD